MEKNNIETIEIIPEKKKRGRKPKPKPLNEPVKEKKREVENQKLK